MVPVARRLAALAFAAACAASPAAAQSGYDGYEGMYGRPADVHLDDLISSGAAYEGRAIRTKARLELVELGRYAFRTLMFSQLIQLYPVQEIQFDWEQAARAWMGREVEVVGVFQQAQAQSSAGDARYYIQFWRFTGPPEDVRGEIRAEDVSLERLADNPGRWDGKMVHVRGQFRGRNLYGDLPSRSMRDRKDWVIKDDVWSVWISGRKPKGDGFDLDVESKRDTAKWVQVWGRPTTRNGIVYLDAVRVLLGTAPSADKAKAQAAPTPPPAPRPALPAAVVFTLPVEGEPIAQDGQPVLQFSRDMDERTFAGRVLLRYAGPPRPGDRAFVGLRLTYDGGRKALTVDPGDALLPGRVLEVVLLPGITDVAGQPLVARPGGTRPPDVAELFRFRVAM